MYTTDDSDDSRLKSDESAGPAVQKTEEDQALYVSPRQAAALAGVSERTIARAIKSGAVVAQRLLSNVTRIHRATFLALLASMPTVQEAHAGPRKGRGRPRKIGQAGQGEDAMAQARKD